MDSMCSTCAWLFYDEDNEEYVCDCQMDEDDYYRVLEGSYKGCPYYRIGKENRVAGKQD